MIRFSDPSLLFLLVVTLFARIGVMLLLPEGCFSTDMAAWLEVSSLLKQHRNPYGELHTLNWGPVWVWCLSFLTPLCDLLHCSLVRGVQGLLCVSDLVIVTLLYRLGQHAGSKQSIGKGILWLYSISPVPLLLSLQHLNFDGIMLGAVLCAYCKLAEYQRTADSVTWLQACAFLGIALITKTVAGMFLPLLAFHSQSLPRRTLLFGGIVTLSPLFLTLGSLYISSPDTVYQNVFLYRSSVAFFFGLTSLTQALGLRAVHIGAFLLLECLFAVFLIIRLRAPTTSLTSLFLAGALAPLWVLLVGTGFGPQYLLWVWIGFPLLWSIAQNQQRKRMSLMIGMVTTVTSGIYFTLYAIHPALRSGVRTLQGEVSVKEWESVAGIEGGLLFPLFLLVVWAFWELFWWFFPRKSLPA